jgi:CrcB protein
MLDQFQTLPLEWRLAITTGFLGGLTTFSTFTGETLNHILRQQWGWAGAMIFVHVAGSLLAALLGLSLVRGLLRAA